ARMGADTGAQLLDLGVGALTGPLAVLLAACRAHGIAELEPARLQDGGELLAAAGAAIVELARNGEPSRDVEPVVEVGDGQAELASALAHDGGTRGVRIGIGLDHHGEAAAATCADAHHVSALEPGEQLGGRLPAGLPAGPLGALLGAAELLAQPGVLEEVALVACQGVTEALQARIELPHPAGLAH